MKVVFAGTPEFARVALAAIHAAGHTVSLVLTQPDRPAGRGMKLQASPVKQFALEHGLPVAQPTSLRLDGKYPQEAEQARAALQHAAPDAMVVAAYGLILPQWVLDLPRLGCLNIHASLLPRWRGAAPIHRAIEAGDAQTGVTIMQMDAGLDTGDMLAMRTVPVGDATTAQLHDTLADLGGEMIVHALQDAQAGHLQATSQPQLPSGVSPDSVQAQALGITYAHKIDKVEAAINWSQDAAVIARRVRAFNPFPGASGSLRGELIKCWQAQAVPGATSHAPGTVLQADAQGVLVQCGEGALLVTELQRPGGKRLNAQAFLRGFALVPGEVFV
jgi:methionyl-tRNA formyltransferase